MPTKISPQAHRRDRHRIFHLKIRSKIRPKIRVQKIRQKNSVKKSVQISVSFYNCDSPDWFCQCQTSVEDVASTGDTLILFLSQFSLPLGGGVRSSFALQAFECAAGILLFAGLSFEQKKQVKGVRCDFPLLRLRFCVIWASNCAGDDDERRSSCPRGAVFAVPRQPACRRLRNPVFSEIAVDIGPPFRRQKFIKHGLFGQLSGKKLKSAHPQNPQI